mmetsp:Transcript_30605/g.72197  ORF Transcript_30605/g.72197 Transcript_30605/m.72197 type:complete len:387 (+) Transcript_30605:96-1256(+)|eukprot:CAMPEP_0172396866 /NCGR_PEP_ID=MMETSP1061-20121228/27463_1 /TAXON_ID=37318 /ORGANISM="Pseudo-nitzschia pungens, Strain cf. pungens" /LENGTH=386 /DNA_ID=CAMNT_0013128841 /DNA_START=70 /DNA_END=1230 /DNA_ORIENTATION=-
MRSIHKAVLLGISVLCFNCFSTASAWVQNANVGSLTKHRSATTRGTNPISFELLIEPTKFKRVPTRLAGVNDSELVVMDKTPEHDGKQLSRQDASSGDLELSAEHRLINLIFLTVSFGYAFYTILNIDSGMTRGWSASEIAMRIPLDNWGAYESYLDAKPIVTKTLINVIIYLLGDWLSQTAFRGKNLLEFDISRTLRNGFIGLCFGPLVHQYYEFSDAILPPENGLVTRLQKIFMDQTIYLTVKCSVYICAVGLLAGEDLATVTQSVKDKIGGIVQTAWKFWPIVHCITYSVIPAQHRILWVNSVDLVWNAILSSAAQRNSVFEEVGGAEEESPTREIESREVVLSMDKEAVAVFSASEVDDTSTSTFSDHSTNTTATTEVLVPT